MADTPTDPNLRDERQKTADLTVQKMIDRTHPVLIAIISVFLVVASFGGFAVFLLGAADAQTVRTLKPLEDRQNITAQQLLITNANVAEFGKDIRELYRVTPAVGYSPRLAAEPIVHALDAGVAIP